MGGNQSAAQTTRPVLTLPAYRGLTVRQHHNRKEDLVRRVGFESESIGFDWDGHHPKVESKLKKFADCDHKGLRSIYIHGPVATGKTGFLVCMLKQMFHTWALKQTGNTCVLPKVFALGVFKTTHWDLLEIVHDDYRAWEQRRQGFTVQDVCRAGLLLLDDFALEDNPNNIRRLEYIIDFRWRNRAATWITSNISPVDLCKAKAHPEYVGLASRLFDKSWMAQARIVGKDRRQG